MHEATDAGVPKCRSPRDFFPFPERPYFPFLFSLVVRRSRAHVLSDVKMAGELRSAAVRDALELLSEIVVRERECTSF